MEVTREKNPNADLHQARVRGCWVAVSDDDLKTSPNLVKLLAVGFSTRLSNDCRKIRITDGVAEPQDLAGLASQILTDHEYFVRESGNGLATSAESYAADIARPFLHLLKSDLETKLETLSEEDGAIFDLMTALHQDIETLEGDTNDGGEINAPKVNAFHRRVARDYPNWNASQQFPYQSKSKKFDDLNL